MGSIYKDPELFVEYGQYVKSKYDFADEATRFFYDSAEVMYKTRTQTFNKTTVSTFMAEEEDRLRQYKAYQGWKTIEDWMNLALPEDSKNYFEILKKYSLLREYNRKGFINVSSIIKHPKFETLSAMDIYRLIRSKVDRINTVIMTNAESEILNTNISEVINSCLEAPDMGLRIPYPILNDIFRGMKPETLFTVGMLSNDGKTRFMFKLIAYIALVLKEKVQVFLNEMTISKMKFCLLTTVINNDEFQELHGYRITKKEKEIALGLYRNSEGDFIYREKDDWGDFTEDIEHYIRRVANNSKEYRTIMKVAKWIEDETQGLIFIEDVSTGYDDKSLEFKFKKANLTHGIRYFFYDTLKQDTNVMGDWAALKATTTKLSQLSRELKSFIYGSIQLTDDAVYIPPDELTSNQIANAKQLKHVVDCLVMFKRVNKKDYKKYHYLAYNEDWGSPSYRDLDPDKQYYIGCVDKNRDGEKVKVLFEVDLNLNTWYEVGRVSKKL